MHANTIGLKAVLADGTIMDNMTTLRKDNTGYDLKHLFIGSEGTLGVITECALLCPPNPTKKHIAMVSVRTFDDVLTLLHKTKAVLGDILYAYEVMDSQSMDLVLGEDTKAVFPLTQKYPFYVIIETGSREPLGFGSDSAKEDEEKQKNDADLDKMFQLFDYAGDQICDGVVAQDMKQFKQVWYLREQIAPAGVSYGYVSSEGRNQFAISLTYRSPFVLSLLVSQIRRLFEASRLLQVRRGHQGHHQKVKQS